MRHRENKEAKLVKINDLFAKYRAVLKAPEGSVITAVCEVTKRVTGCELPRERVRYNVRDRMVFLQVRGVLKSEVLLHKRTILEQLKLELGERSAPYDLR